MTNKFSGYCLGLLTVVACSSGAGGSGARAARAARVEPAVRSAAPAPVAKNAPVRAPLSYQGGNEHDRVFIENAERAIGQYSEFIARAGSNQEYAAAVERSRQQIQDLRDAIVFVRAGAVQP